MPEAKPPENQPTTPPAAQNPTPAPQPAPTPANAPPASALKAFLTSLPGLLTAIGGAIAAIATMISALDKAALLRRPTPLPSPTAIVAQAPEPTATLLDTPTPPPTATQAPSPTSPPPTATPEPTLTASPAPPEGALLVEDFSVPNRTWETASDPDFEARYADGEYRILVHLADITAWAGPKRSTAWTDLAVEVDARQIEGPEGSSFGLLVRMNPAEASFYYFSISSDGGYAVTQHTPDGWTDLVPWEPTDAVYEMGQTNHLYVECLGAHMRFLVNGALLTEIEDDSYPAGDISLAVSGSPDGQTDVRFDNVRVQVLRRFQ